MCTYPVCKKATDNLILEFENLAMKHHHRLILFALIAAVFRIPLLGQPVLTEQPPNLEIMPGQVFLITINFTRLSGVTPQVYRAYLGEKPDKANEVPGLRFAGDEAAFDGRGVTETTQYWFEICNDFGCLQTDTVTVTVIGDEPTGPPAPFGDAAELGEGWWFSDWFGTFNIGFFPWIFHSQHAWMFVFEASVTENIFLYDLSTEGWFFTASSQYPNLFSFERNAWVFYFEGTSAPRQFVDLQSGGFFSED